MRVLKMNCVVFRLISRDIPDDTGSRAYRRRFEWIRFTKLDVDLECSAFVRSSGLQGQATRSVIGIEVGNDGKTYRPIHDQVPLCKVCIVGYDVHIGHWVFLKVGQLLLSRLISLRGRHAVTADSPFGFVVQKLLT